MVSPFLIIVLFYENSYNFFSPITLTLDCYPVDRTRSHKRLGWAGFKWPEVIRFVQLLLPLEVGYKGRHVLKCFCSLMAAKAMFDQVRCSTLNLQGRLGRISPNYNGDHCKVCIVFAQNDRSPRSSAMLDITRKRQSALCYFCPTRGT